MDEVGGLERDVNNRKHLAESALFSALWFLAWGVASSIWCLTAAGQLGATFDEPVYVTRGLEGWRTGSHHGLLKMGTMPLPADVQTLPLYLWERWTGVAFDPASDLDRLLPWARATTLLFWWLLLGYGWLAGRALAGPWGGRLAVALLACEPTLLAHASLATTDIAISACLLALVYHFQTGRKAGWVRRVGLPALWFAAAVLAKASGLVFGPLCLLAVEFHRWWNGEAVRWWGREESPLTTHHSPLTTSFLRDLVQIGSIGLVLVFLYCGSDGQPQASFVAWAHRLPDSAWGRSMVWLAENLRIFRNAGEGLVRQIKHNMNAHDGTYLLGKSWPPDGQTSPRSVWYYFPVALAIKLSVPLLILPVALVLVRPRALWNWACLAAAVLLVFSLNCRVQIGVRLVLPLVTLAVVGLASAAVQACREWRMREGKRTRSVAFAHALMVLLAAGVLWTTLTAVRVWPHGLCYVNELWGGTANGYRCLSDSNYDWGQGLGELASWQQRQQADLDVWYFGTDPVLKKVPLREVPLHNLPITSPEDVHTHVKSRYLAVSTTLLYGRAAPTPAHERASAYLRSLQPVARTTTFLIYDFASSSKRGE